MPRVSMLAQKALEEIQRAVPPGRTYAEAGQVVLNLLKLAPQGSALARALSKSRVWSDGLREQHTQAWSGLKQYSHLPRLGAGGPQVDRFFDRVEAARDSDGAAEIGERHVARALVGNDGTALAEMGINGAALVEEVTRLEGTPPPPPASTPRRVELEALHPKIREAAGSLFATGHYSEAIFAAFKAVEIRVREVSRLEGFGRDLMARALGGDSPPIRIATSQDQTGKAEQDGFKFLFMGAMLGIRDPKAHGDVQQTDPQRTLEYLAFASLLMRRLDDSAGGDES